MKAESNQTNLDDIPPEHVQTIANRLLTIDEAAAEIGIPPKTALFFIQIGALPVVMRHGVIFVRYDSARRFACGTGTGRDITVRPTKQAHIEKRKERIIPIPRL